MANIPELKDVSHLNEWYYLKLSEINEIYSPLSTSRQMEILGGKAA